MCPTLLMAFLVQKKSPEFLKTEIVSLDEAEVFLKM